MCSDVALMIIDVQLGMFDEDEHVANAEKILPTFSDLIARARQATVPVVYIQHNDSELVKSSPAWPIHPSIAPLAGDVIVQKRTPDSFHETGLGDELEIMGIKELIVGGIQTEYCVDTTCRRAFSLGYEVTLIENGHTTWDNEFITAQQVIAHHNNTLDGWAATIKPAEGIQFN